VVVGVRLGLQLEDILVARAAAAGQAEAKPEFVGIVLLLETADVLDGEWGHLDQRHQDLLYSDYSRL
jgi:hypothetical protein